MIYKNKNNIKDFTNLIALKLKVFLDTITSINFINFFNKIFKYSKLYLNFTFISVLFISFDLILNIIFELLEIYFNKNQINKFYNYVYKYMYLDLKKFYDQFSEYQIYYISSYAIFKIK